MMREYYSRERVRNTALYITPRLATFLFNYLQLGTVILVAKSLSDNPKLVCLLLAFEIGILADCFIRRGTIWSWALISFCSAAALAYFMRFTPDGFAFIPLMFSVALLSISLKKVRSSTDALGKIKRFWRALGYLVAGFFSPWATIVFAALLLGTVYLSGVYQRTDSPLPEKFRLDATRLGPYLVVMLHHLHYFGYAYMVVFVFYSITDFPPETLGPIFYVGWLGYYLFINAKRNRIRLVVWGHTLAALSVFGMLFTGTPSVLLAFWFLTGVGGGTIVLLREANIRDDPAVYERFKTWEAFGHVLGLLVLVIAVLFELPVVSFAIAGVAGLACAAGAALWNGSDRDRTGTIA